MNLKKLGIEKILVFVLALMLAFSLVACGGGSSSLVGKWVPEEGQEIPDNFFEKNFELSKDGTGINDMFSLKWKAEKGRLTITFDMGFSFAYNYKISGTTLILTNDDGESAKYSKK
jgi:hypothetical protein